MRKRAFEERLGQERGKILCIEEAAAGQQGLSSSFSCAEECVRLIVLASEKKDLERWSEMIVINLLWSLGLCAYRKIHIYI